MRQVHRIEDLDRSRPSVLTIGAFDGVHGGHQYLIGQTVERAREFGHQSVVVTFDPRPQVVLRPNSLQLTDGPDKAELIAALGPDLLLMLPFTRELASQPAEVFLVDLLEHADIAEIWVGADFAFGHNRSGDVNFLIRNGEAYGFAVHVVSRQALDEGPISSTRVRSLVSEGDVAGAARLLGHYPGFSGLVVKGHGRGRPLGYPTANVEPPPAQLIPQTGIYAGYAGIGERRIPAAISVGYNPVFAGERLTVEAYLLDFDEDLHGQAMLVQFANRLRDERNFESVDALVEQMARDVEATREILGVGAGIDGAA